MRATLIAAASASVLTLALASSCASRNASQKKEAPAPVVAAPQPAQTQRITNYQYFDLGTCFPPELEMTPPVTAEALSAFLLWAKPSLDECLVDPANRGKSAVTAAVIGVTVGATSVEFTVEGANLTDAGKSCVRAALSSRPGLEPLGATAAPVKAEIDYQHDANVSPAVTFGINAASDIVARIRLAMPGWCDCFAAWRSRSPHTLSGELAVQAPPSVTFSEEAEEAARSVQSCLVGKVPSAAQPGATELRVPLKFVFIHSGIPDPLEGEPADLAAVQLEAIRTYVRADVLLKLGARASAVSAWNGMVTRYSANPRAYTVKQLKAGCAALITADDALLAAHEKARDAEERALAFFQAQPDGALKEQEQASLARLATITSDLGTAKAQRAADSAGCPRMR